VTIKFVAIPPNQDFDFPEGFRVVEFYGVSIMGGRPTSALITNEPDTRVYKPENVAWGPGEFTYSDQEPEQVQVSSFAITEPDGSREICGKPYNGVLCSFPPHAKGRHSFEPEDSSDAEIRPDYYKGKNDLEPWDVIKAFDLDYWRATAVAYLCRAGLKDDEPTLSEIADLRKAYTFIGERIRQLTAEFKPPADEYMPMGEYIKKRYPAEFYEPCGNPNCLGHARGEDAPNPDEGLHGAY
jgi:hypothetical protein